jgi:hypothetical protein
MSFTSAIRDYMKSGENATTKTRNTGVEATESILLSNYKPGLEVSSFYVGIEMSL